jgi:hypothetical protein
MRNHRRIHNHGRPLFPHAFAGARGGGQDGADLREAEVLIGVANSVSPRALHVPSDIYVGC